MAIDLTNVAVSTGYVQLLHIDGGVGGSVTRVYDGDGTGTPLQISTSEVQIIDGAYNFDIASHDGTNGLKLGGTLVTSSAAELNLLDGITAGTVSASKFLLVDSNKDLSGIRNLTGTGTAQFANFTATGDSQIGDAVSDTVAVNATITTNLVFEGSTANDYETTLAITDPTADRTWTIPDSTDTFVGKVTTDTLTNKTLTAPVLNTVDINGGTVDAITTLTVANSVDIGNYTITANGFTADGTIQYGSLSDGAITITAFESSLTSGAALVPTSAAVKTYVDAQVTAQDLDFSGDSGGALNIDLDSESLTFTGGTGVVTVGSGNTMTFNSVDSEIVHDSLSGFVANEHIDHTSVTLTAGVGLSGGGTIAADRTFTVDLNELTTETTIADADFIAMVDATDSGSGKITFENLEDAIFASVSGDVLITEAGVASIQANSVALTTDTTGDYVQNITAGTGLTSTGATSGENIAHSLSVDASQAQVTTVGTLNAGAISSGFGAIDIGSSNLTTTGTVSLGATSFSGAIDFNSQNMTEVDIDSGTIDGATIATSNVTVGSGKTLDVSAGTLTLAANQISGDKVEGGTIAATTISALTTAGITASANLNIAVTDNSATSLTIKQGSDAYLIIDTADTSESVAIGTGVSGTAVSIGHGTSETIVNDNLTVTGDLTVSGTTTTVSSGTLTIGDTLIKLGQAYTGSAYDQGIVFTRGDGSSTNTQNMAFIWDESADTFAVIKAATEAGTTSGNVTVTDHVPLRVGALTADDASTFTSTISAATGSTIGDLTLANGSITSSGAAISFGSENLSTSGTLGAGVITATGLTIGSAVITEAELEILDGASLSTTELNYVDGVTSAIQTQIDTKAPLASPTFTGTITIGSAGISETELEILDGLTVTTDELNIMDGSATTQATVTLAGTDGVVISDGDVMKQALVSDFEVYMEANLDTMGSQFTSASSLATVGALSSGSIASGFGAINNGANTITTTGLISGGTLGVGIARTEGTLHVHTATAGTVTASTQADDLVVENSAEGGITIITPDAQSARIRFTSPSTNTDVGGADIFYRQNINKMSFGTSVSGGIIAIKSGAAVEAINIDANQKVGIGTDSPAGALHIAGTGVGANMYVDAHTNGGDGPNLIFRKSNNTTIGGFTKVDSGDILGQIYFQGADTDSWETGGAIRAVSTEDWSASARGTKLEFYTVDNTTTTADLNMVIDHSGNVGIGTATPGAPLDIQGTGAQDQIRFKLNDNYVSAITAQWHDSAASNYLSFDISTGSGTQNTNVLYLNGAGNVGIGTDSPGAKLEVASRIQTILGTTALYVDSQSGYGQLSVYNTGGGSYPLALQMDGGNVGIGTASPTRKVVIYDNSPYLAFQSSHSGATASDGFQIQKDTGNIVYLWNYENTAMLFGNNGAERMRILAGGGLTFNGDTAAANALNDYEEGTFTLTAAAGSGTIGLNASFNTCSYVKIGRLVHFQGYVHNNTFSSTPSGVITFGGFPFATGDRAQASGQGNIMYRPNGSGADAVYIAAIPESASGANVQGQTADGWDADVDIYISGTYQTA